MIKRNQAKEATKPQTPVHHASRTGNLQARAEIKRTTTWECSPPKSWAIISFRASETQNTGRISYLNASTGIWLPRLSRPLQEYPTRPERANSLASLAQRLGMKCNQDNSRPKSALWIKLRVSMLVPTITGTISRAIPWQHLYQTYHTTSIRFRLKYHHV